MLSAIQSYRLIAGDLSRSLARVAAEPAVARDSRYYMENIEKVASIDQFLKNDRLFGFAMTAFGLADMKYAKAFMRKVLEGGIDDPKSFANRLADQRYRDFAAAFNFARYGETTTIFDRTRQGTVDRYVRQTLEQQAGRENEAVRLALYFERQAPQLRSVYGLLADPALLKVVQTALGLSPASSNAAIERQAAAISSKIDIADFRDPAKLRRFLERFASRADAEGAAARAPVIAAFSPAGGINVEILARLQQIRRG